MTWKAWAGLAAVAALGAGGYVVFGMGGWTRSTTIGQILRDNGFTEFKPPTRDAVPGTLVRISGTDPLTLATVCRSEQALGLAAADIRVSPSASSDLSAALDRTLEIEGSLLDRLKAGGRLNGVEDIRIALGNVRILELSDDDVIRALPNRDPACAEALRLRLEGDEPVTMIKAALMADVTYTATTRTSAGGEVSADLRQELSTVLGSKVTGSDGGTVTLAGADLIWGIRDDRVLALLGVTLPATGTEAGGLPEQRILGVEAAVAALVPAQ